MRCVHIALLCSLGVGAQAQPLPDFAECIAREQSRFESTLGHGKETVALLGVSGVDYCGGVGIAACDRTGKPIGCQVHLAKTQDALRGDVLAQLPEPKDDALYGRLHGLAFGASAGPDCTGTTAPMMAWCMAWEANAALRSAVLAWQHARALGAVPDAVTAGWAQRPSATRPKGREDK